MLHEAQDLLGKTITGIVVKEGTSPKAQVFLTFADGTYFEFYSRAERIEVGSHAYAGGPETVQALGYPTQETVLVTRLTARTGRRNCQQATAV